MKKNKKNTSENDRIRQLAEQKLINFPENIDKLTLSQIKNALHELRVYQIELEMQNEELRKTKIELDLSREKYFDLYNLAPVGYLTFNGEGIIEEANLTAANLLNTKRSLLLKRPITQFIFKEDQDIFYLEQKKLVKTKKNVQFDIRMKRKKESIFWSHIVTVFASHNDETSYIKLTMTDVSERKRIENALEKAMDEIRTLHGILPICSGCKKIRDEKGYWNQVEEYIRERTDAEFSHCLCPNCLKELYPEYEKEVNEAINTDNKNSKKE